MVRQSELQCEIYGRRKGAVNSSRVASESTLSQFWKQLSAKLLLSCEKEMSGEHGTPPYIATNGWHSHNFSVWSVPGQIFNVDVRVRVLNVFVIVLILLFSLHSILDDTKPRSSGTDRQRITPFWLTEGSGFTASTYAF
ncbi:hypothetical protein PIB30_044953 [Stylosanthes scabra]|uniref:Uncharacterized protein n=1 Tax=Stylosanthes scabra TaxID=79078 RepID=A0ABU6SFV6_9FABA|nr:hypothetical protein [Stylosanthes scabra]